MNNWKLEYSGGSGGFLLLHLLLLSEKFHAVFEKELTLDQIIQEHWNIASPDQWKKSEIWPNNQLTASSQAKSDKIYFHCNPYDYKNYSTEFAGKKIVIYTDLHSQRLLAHYKRANWYNCRESRVFDVRYTVFKTFLKRWQEYYNNIKDPDWPKCISIRHLSRLPKNIQTEIISNPYTEYFLNFTYQEPEEFFNDELVYKPMVPFLKSADIVIKLQDLVNSNATILEKLFDIGNINVKQIELLNKWKQFHSNELLINLGISV